MEPLAGPEERVLLPDQVSQEFSPHSLLIYFLSVSEKAREYLHKTGRFIVIGGIISPVHDSYGKPVSAGDGVYEDTLVLLSLCSKTA